MSVMVVYSGDSASAFLTFRIIMKMTSMFGRVGKVRHHTISEKPFRYPKDISERYLGFHKELFSYLRARVYTKFI